MAVMEVGGFIPLSLKPVWVRWVVGWPTAKLAAHCRLSGAIRGSRLKICMVLRDIKYDYIMGTYA